MINVEEYKEFMHNEANIRKCEHCPENRDMSDWNDRLPCGQFRCWVTAHCHPELKRS